MEEALVEEEIFSPAMAQSWSRILVLLGKDGHAMDQPMCQILCLREGSMADHGRGGEDGAEEESCENEVARSVAAGNLSLRPKTSW